MADHRCAAVIAFLTLLLPHQSLAYPWRWAQPSKCDRHPESAQDIFNAPHRFGSTSDGSIAFTVSAPSGTLVPLSQPLCPGVPYTVTATLPRSGHYLLTSTYGSLGSLCSAAPACGNTVCTANSGQKISHAFTIPCGTAEGASNVLRVSWTDGMQGTIISNRATYTISSANCPTSTCTGTSPPPVDPPAPTAKVSVASSKRSVRAVPGARGQTTVTITLTGAEGTEQQLVTVSSTDAAVIDCTPRKPVIKSNRATTVCTAKAPGKARIRAKFGALLGSVLVTVRP